MFEQWKVIGYRKVGFTDQKTRKRVEGYSLFLVKPGEGEGMTVMKHRRFSFLLSM